MRAAIRLLRAEANARWFFAALAQSSIGSGAAYVALLLIAYERFRSPWAVSLVLLADFAPSMLVGPLLGAAADRWSRRWCAVTADVVRALAFVGIAVVPSFEATVGFALAAGLGTAIFRPAVLAGVPSLVSADRAAAATSVYGAVTEVGWIAGPALAAGLLLAMSPENLMTANAVTFAVSAVVLARLPLDRPSQVHAQDGVFRRSLMREAIEGAREVSRLIDIRVVMLASTGAMFFGGIFNVGELFFATDALSAGDSGYAILVAAYGIGFIAGSLAGAEGGETRRLRRRYLQGLALTGAGMLCASVAPTLLVALSTFALAGFGNGLFAAHERLLIQQRIEGNAQGRAFALTDSLVSWALAAAFLVAGGCAELLGPRGLILATGVGITVVTVIAFLGLRRHAEVRRERLSPLFRSSRP